MKAMHFYNSPDGKYQVALSSETLLTMLELAQQAGNLETGGILVGSYDHTHTTALVSRALPPPADSKSSRFWFKRGVEGLSRLLKQLWYSPQRTFYLGEWHSHPQAGARPSSEDFSTMIAKPIRESFGCPEPILVVIGFLSMTRYEVTVWVFPGDERKVELTLRDAE